jgi:Sec-independent protein translocase protein TatA
VLGLTWNEIGFVAFLFVLVWAVGYLPGLGNAIGDFLYGFRSGDRKKRQD